MEWKIKKRHSMKKKDIKELKAYIRNEINENLVTEGEYEMCKLSNGWEIILVDKVPSFLVIEEVTIPSLKLLVKNKVKDFKKYVVVDMGAVPYIANGADVMAPGIVEIGAFGEGEFVFVGDEKNGKILSIGRSLVSSEDLTEKNEGKAIETLHYVGDVFWTFEV